MGNLRDKYTDEEWDALVEQANKRKEFRMSLPPKYTLTGEELLDFIHFVKVNGSYSTPDKVLEYYMEKVLPENKAKLEDNALEKFYKIMDKEVHSNNSNLNK